MNRDMLYLGAYAFGAAWLLGWEISALATGQPQYTISDFTWSIEGPGISAARFFIAAVLIWLTLHLSLGWFR